MASPNLKIMEPARGYPTNHILVDRHASGIQNQQDQKGFQMTQCDARDVLLNQGDLIAVAAIVIGFGLTVIMFRIQRELYIREEKQENTWIAWADWLIFVSIFLVVVLTVIPLLAFSYRALASAACAAAIILQAGYIPAILAHYRIDIGKNRTGKRDRGEPAEKWIVCVSCVIALVFFVLTWQHSR